MTRARILPRAFYARDSRDVAPELLGKLLVRSDPRAGRVAARLVEVEAYCGPEDPGSHAYRGRTPRNATMFGPPGHLYVYFTYGMHWCANVVCGTVGWPGAVLLRAAAPVDGLPALRARRPRARRDRDLCAGPARLTEAFGVDRAFDGTDLVRGPGELRIVDDGTPPPARPVVSPRVGLAPGRGEHAPWRWCVPGDRHVSRHGRLLGSLATVSPAGRSDVATQTELVGHLREVPLFSKCSRRELDTIARQVSMRDVDAGTRLVRQGQAGDAFFVLLEGRAAVRRNGRKVNDLGPGDFFGELALLDPAPRNADVVATSPVMVAVLGVRTFRALLREMPTMNERLLAGLARRVRDADRRIIE